ncbi:hypothetical protein [Bacteroides sp.]|uniref:hypothetical protein n=1 Tax=Bacteroides sp. TaxID=29523 RepID=UPI002FC5C479
MKKYIFVLMLLLCIGCESEDTTVDTTVMPEATTTGADTFGCLIDGWLYVGGRYGAPPATSSIRFEYYPAKDIVNVYVYVKMLKPIRFTIHSPQVGKTTTYTDASFGFEPLEDGNVTITHLDKKRRIISGTFEGGQTSKGRFDIHYLEIKPEPQP